MSVHKCEFCGSKLRSVKIREDGRAYGPCVKCDGMVWSSLTNTDTPRHMIPDMVRDIADFHDKFNIGYHGPPRALPLAIRPFREQRLNEELSEYNEACLKCDYEKELDGLVDLIYIALGTAHCHGWDFYEAWRRVHAANMAKVMSSPNNPGKYGCSQDIVKPVGWRAPDLSDLVAGIEPPDKSH